MIYWAGKQWIIVFIGDNRPFICLYFISSIPMLFPKFLGSCTSLFVWRSPLITFSITPLVLLSTLDPHRIIKETRAAHPTPNHEVKCRLAKLVLRCGISWLKFIAVIPFYSRQLSQTSSSYFMHDKASTGITTTSRFGSETTRERRKNHRSACLRDLSSHRLPIALFWQISRWFIAGVPCRTCSSNFCLNS